MADALQAGTVVQRTHCRSIVLVDVNAALSPQVETPA